MANHKSAEKRHRQSLKANARNKAMKTRVRNAVKAVRAAVSEGNVDQASVALSQATSILDTAAQKKVIHWRNAGRKVSRLSQAVNQLRSA
jgi:small subunit ribosomal protein S20